MGDQMTFKRYEIKYMMTKAQRDIIFQRMEPYMNPDPHGRNTNQSLYFDTPEYILARRSMEKPFYKEKLRMRSYGVANADTEVFMELKKKYDSVVYKRRENMTEAEAMEYISSHKAPRDSQIFREITYALDQYQNLKPAVLLSYDRQAFYAKDDHEFRITFDENILWRDYDVDLTKGFYGQRIIAEDLCLMEIKVAAGIPLWLVQTLSELKLYKTSFSKYGTAYLAILAKDAGIAFEPVTLENRAAQENVLRHTPLYTGIKKTGNHTHTNENDLETVCHLGGNYNYA